MVGLYSSRRIEGAFGLTAVHQSGCSLSVIWWSTTWAVVAKFSLRGGLLRLRSCSLSLAFRVFSVHLPNRVFPSKRKCWISKFFFNVVWQQGTPHLIVRYPKFVSVMIRTSSTCQNSQKVQVLSSSDLEASIRIFQMDPSQKSCFIIHSFTMAVHCSRNIYECDCECCLACFLSSFAQTIRISLLCKRVGVFTLWQYKAHPVFFVVLSGVYLGILYFATAAVVYVVLVLVTVSSVGTFWKSSYFAASMMSS